MLKISFSQKQLNNCTLEIPSSKSISNRALIIQALSEASIELKNLSIADDTKILTKAIQKATLLKNETPIHIDIGLAGTAFRFLCSFLSTQNNQFILTGEKRIQQRPIQTLVDGLRTLGADISYLQHEKYAPLLIKGGRLKVKKIEINAEISSQFISALLLISPILNAEFTLKLKGKISSKPYIDMTLKLMQFFGVASSFSKDTIKVFKGNYAKQTLFIEADWSSASYFYMCLSLAEKGEIILKNYTEKSLQGDSKLVELFVDFGVDTIFENNYIRLVKNRNKIDFFEYDFSNEPDLAQSFISLCVGHGIEAKFCGLESLKIKETNRIQAMHTEIQKLGYMLIESKIKKTYLLKRNNKPSTKNIVFDTYNDHRMAMSLAPLAIKFQNIIIKKPEVVSKSNPHFWIHLEQLGFKIEK